MFKWKAKKETINNKTNASYVDIDWKVNILYLDFACYLFLFMMWRQSAHATEWEVSSSNKSKKTLVHWTGWRIEQWLFNWFSVNCLWTRDLSVRVCPIGLSYVIVPIISVNWIYVWYWFYLCFLCVTY